MATSKKKLMEALDNRKRLSIDEKNTFDNVTSLSDILSSEEEFKFRKSRVDGEIRRLKISEIIVGKYQPRQIFNEDEIDELCHSIKNEGQLQPIIVSARTDKESIYLVAGERRLRACKKIGMEKIEAKIFYDKDPFVVAKIALIENINRKDLNAIEEANGYKKLMDEYNFTQKALAETLGKSKMVISQFIAIANLPDEIKEQALKLNIAKRKLIPITHLKSIDEQLDAFNQLLNGKERTRKPNISLNKMFFKKTNELSKCIQKMAKYEGSYDDVDQLIDSLKDVEKFIKLLKKKKKQLDT